MDVTGSVYTLGGGDDLFLAREEDQGMKGSKPPKGRLTWQVQMEQVGSSGSARVSPGAAVTP